MATSSFSTKATGGSVLSPRVKASLELLGTSSDASPVELKKAYRRMALLYHPDHNTDPDAAREFQKITEAFELLSDLPQVDDLNRRHLKERLHRRVLEDMTITFGSFFGFRLFDLRAQVEGQEAKVETSTSILDHAAYDALEVVYAGRLSATDEARLKGHLDDQRLAQMPWVILNNQGIIRYLAGDLKGARACYEKLCVRVPNNIIFTYRLGLCLILEAFERPTKTLLGASKPNPVKIKKGLELLHHCVKLGATRKFGRQKCLVIRKIIADIYERTGSHRRARAQWRDIYEADPRGTESTYKVKGLEEARRLLKNKAALALQTESTLLLRPGRGL